jgi:hypothetical protein
VLGHVSTDPDLALSLHQIRVWEWLEQNGVVVGWRLVQRKAIAMPGDQRSGIGMGAHAHDARYG